MAAAVRGTRRDHLSCRSAYGHSAITARLSSDARIEERARASDLYYRSPLRVDRVCAIHYSLLGVASARIDLVFERTKNLVACYSVSCWYRARIAIVIGP